MHPLREGSGLPVIEPGRWTGLQRKEQIAEISLTQDVQRQRRPAISSIPSPWARIQLFRDAIMDMAHPAHDDVVNDILDAIELVLLQQSLRTLALSQRTVVLQDLLQLTGLERKPGIIKFLESLVALAPEVVTGDRFESLMLVFNRDVLLFATSPFTIVVTPELIRTSIPGYFERNRPIRPLSERPPILSQYVRDNLLRQLGQTPAGALPELQQLSRLLNGQLAEPSTRDQSVAFVEAGIFPVSGVSLHRTEGGTFASALTIAPRRSLTTTTPLPLVLTNSKSPDQARFFSWLERPSGSDISKTLDRDVLPGTTLQHGWISPDFDFLTDKLILLDAPLLHERLHTPAGATTGLLARTVLPLKPAFFQYFRAVDVLELVSLRSEGPETDPRIVVRLTVPTSGGSVVVEKEYTKPARIAASVSLWPAFEATAGAAWRDYYLICFVDGQDVNQALSLDLGAGGRSISVDYCQRDLSTAVLHHEGPPECVFIGQRTGLVGDTSLGQGVLLPKLRPAPSATLDPWTVAIDFGTSNTVVAFRAGDKRAPLTVTSATRFDLTKQLENDDRIGRVLDTFFFPTHLSGTPFATVVLRGLATDRSSVLASIPALTANVPFSGEVSVGMPSKGGFNPLATGFANDVVGDLKWGGGGKDGERLTGLFLHQVLQLIYAEARGSGVQTEGMVFRWAYPSAFSPRKQGAMSTQWDTLLADFTQQRLSPVARDDGGGTREPPASSNQDEGTSSMLYLRTDPAAEEGFAPNSKYLKLTADVGGGTTDTAGYAGGGIILRHSILWGGRDLVSETGTSGDQSDLFRRIYEWALRKELTPDARRVLDAYPTNHTKFTYLVKHPWFHQHRPQLSSEPWFPAVQACVLYFYGVIHYNLGLGLRDIPSAGFEAPDYLFFGGNGSSYLNWLTEFQPWNGSPMRAAFSQVFQSLFEAGYGRPLGLTLEVLTSSRPKHEVALGLLEDDVKIKLNPATTEPPVGESISLTGTSHAYGPGKHLPTSMVAQHGIPKLHFDSAFADREIVRFNSEYQRQLEGLSKTIDPHWGNVAREVQSILGALDERFYENRISNALNEHLRKDDIGSVTLFVIEADATLRQLERRLLGK
jgi:hypothetical protein